MADRSATAPVRFLFLFGHTSDLEDQNRLNLVVEAMELRELLEPLEEDGRVALHFEPNTCKAQVTRLIQKHKPQVLHISAHGSAAGSLVLCEKIQRHVGPVEYTLEELVQCLEATSDIVECVVLNGCQTEALARAVGQHVAFSVGLQNAVSDIPAIAFSAAFHLALAQGATLEKALLQARSALTDENLRGVQLVHIEHPDLPDVKSLALRGDRRLKDLWREREDARLREAERQRSATGADRERLEPRWLDPLSPQSWRPQLEYLVAKHAHIELLGIRRHGGAVQVPLDQVYVELRAERTYLHDNSHDRVPRMADGVLSSGDLSKSSTEPVAADPFPELGPTRAIQGAPDRGLRLHEALAGTPRAVVVGDPGSGKTTLLRFVARVVAEGLLRPADNEATARLLLGLASEHPLPFPVFITVSALDAWLEARNLTASEVRVSHLLEFMHEELVGRAGLELDVAGFGKAVAGGHVLVLLDGLDEVPGYRARRRVARGVSELLARHNTARLLLTSRTRAWEPEVAATLGGLAPLHLQPMSETETQRFLRQWHAAVWAQDLVHGQKVADALFLEIQGHPQVRRMADNPNVLTLIAILKYTGTKLPDRRVELYREVVDLFLERKDVARELEDQWKAALGFHLDLSEKRLLVARLALEMHAGGDAGRVVPAKVPISNLARQLRDGGRAADDAEAEGLAERLLDVLELRSGLMRREGMGVQFAHLGYQEYLAAYALSMVRRDEDIWSAVGPHVADDWWREVLLLLAGVLENASGPLLVQLSEAGGGEKVDWKLRGRGVALAMSALQDLPPLHVTPDVRRKVLAGLESITGATSRARAADRIEALRALGQVGDPRLGMDKNDRWVLIPPGTFIMGEDDDAHQVHLTQGFRLGRFPVTNDEYRLFVEEQGYGDPRWWSDEGWSERQKECWTEPQYWRDSRFNTPNHPVVGVSWYEAEAWCAWLTTWLTARRPEWIPTDARVTLPTEAQWEFATRGTEGRKFPWGNGEPDMEAANFENNVGATSPVGAYPRGNTLEGIHDMGGNVWEWCTDWHCMHETGSCRVVMEPLGPESGSIRVLRGGSWYSAASVLRGAYRNRHRPSYRNNRIGFRVVLPAGRDRSR